MTRQPPARVECTCLEWESTLLQNETMLESKPLRTRQLMVTGLLRVNA